jgi:3D (Asp-Asp-Asp) domain-containing protein
LYVEGEPDPIAVLLGAGSLPAILAGIDELERTTLVNRGIAAELGVRSRTLQTQLAALSRLRHDVAVVEHQARAAVATRERAATAQRATVDAIRRRAGVTRARLAAIRKQAQAAQRASTRLTRSSAPALVPSTLVGSSGATRGPAIPAPAAGTRSLVVDAVAYHLSGRTASGLPVGVGVIAVDPGVIPLGTRVFVPGYGPAVAADVGSAIRGAIIDLWMPSTAAARAWGRRTVTITVYG